jgi:hypothetical protein
LTQPIMEAEKSQDLHLKSWGTRRADGASSRLSLSLMSQFEVSQAEREFFLPQHFILFRSSSIWIRSITWWRTFSYNSLPGKMWISSETLTSTLAIVFNQISGHSVTHAHKINPHYSKRREAWHKITFPRVLRV